MKPPAFAYVRADSVEEALAALAEAGSDGKVLAGGQSLIPLLNMRLAAPGVLVDVNRIGLDEIEVSDAHVRIGATVRHAALERHAEARSRSPLLSQALVHVAHPVIRNRGTTVGSIAHADPAGEMPAVMAILGGHAEVSSADGHRTVSADDLFVGPLESSLAPGELVTHIVFPHPPAGSGTSFHELARRHGDYAMAGVGAIVTLDENRRVSGARVGFIGLGSVPVVVDLSDALGGAAADELDVTAAAREAVDATDPQDDIHATAAYRRHLATVLTERALREAAAAATDRTEVSA